MTHRDYFVEGTTFRQVDLEDIATYCTEHSSELVIARIGCQADRLSDIRRVLRMQLDAVADDQTRKCMTLIALALEVL